MPNKLKFYNRDTKTSRSTSPRESQGLDNKDYWDTKYGNFDRHINEDLKRILQQNKKKIKQKLNAVNNPVGFSYSLLIIIN